MCSFEVADSFGLYACIAAVIWAVAWGITREQVWSYKAKIEREKHGPERARNGQFKKRED